MSVFYSEVNLQLCTPKILEQHFFINLSLLLCCLFIRTVFKGSYPVTVYVQTAVQNADCMLVDENIHSDKPGFLFHPARVQQEFHLSSEIVTLH